MPLSFMYSAELHFWIAQLAEKEFRMKLAGLDIEEYMMMGGGAGGALGKDEVLEAERLESVSSGGESGTGEKLQHREPPVAEVSAPVFSSASQNEKLGGYATTTQDPQLP
ncbi:unnamed protein product, partial [Amoebophrya sp. A25]|eukprot:GSA25T00017403001.1